MKHCAVYIFVVLLMVITNVSPWVSAQSLDSHPVRQAGKAIVEDRGELLYLGNNRVEMVFFKNSASMKSLKVDGQELLGPARYPDRGEGYIQCYPIGGYRNAKIDRVKVDQRDGLIDIGFFQKNDLMPFAMEVHYVLRDGEGGFYGYIALDYDHQDYLAYREAHNARNENPKYEIAADADAYMEQLNFCFFLNDQLFQIEQVDDDRRRRLRSKRQQGAQRIMDATFLEPDGRVYTKYDYAFQNEGHRLHGVMGHTFGAWVMQGSGEHLNGGPTTQELSTEHGILLQHYSGAHFGSGRIVLSPEEDGWSKLAGPFYFYFNRGSDQVVLWSDAKRVAEQFVADSPYGWMEHPLYAKRRGRVEGRLVFSDGSPCANALVLLAQPPGTHEPPWQQQGKGFMFWDRTDSEGYFSVEKVRPNHYSLYALHDDTFGEFRYDSVEVVAGAVAQLGTLSWDPLEHAKVVWQIGRPDRDAGEFALGQGKAWGRWRSYRDWFPDDVKYTVGQSDPTRDWCAFHTVAVGDDGRAYAPTWIIHFAMAESPMGRATLRLGVAGVRGDRLGANDPQVCGVEVLVNGQSIGRADYENDSSPTRSGTSGRYRESAFEFDAKLLREGENTVSLDLKPLRNRIVEDSYGKLPSGILMYDALRLEIEESR